ncbi:MAG: hypothetical protein JW891_06610, partial [Candidatus Lokiarchaeota archaeon]|nr:hypothetical protein [Candidatus Lokiarchaeota archaeon]
ELKELIKKEKRELQKKKFNIINNLINDLYNHKNSREHFKLISNQIILLLTLTNQKRGFDLFFDDNEKEEFEDKEILKNMLKNEL